MTKVLTHGSHQNVEVTCAFGVSDKCRGTYNVTHKDAVRYRANNAGLDICLPCSRKTKASGRSNPNCQYPLLNDALFTAVETAEDAYLLGLIAAEGNFKNDGVISISMLKSDAYELLVEIASYLKTGAPKRASHGMCYVTICSQQVVQNAMKILNLSAPGPKSSDITLPQLSPTLIDSFMLGYFDGDGCLSFVEEQYNYPRVSIASNSHTFLQSVFSHYGIPGSVSLSRTNGTLEYAGANALDFLGRLYTARPSFCLERKHLAYQRLCLWQPSLLGSSKVYPTLKCVKTLPNAVLPTKAHPSDSGYDLTIVSKVKDNGDVAWYDTGIKVTPPDGFWLALVPRSSISKTGYMLANSVGIIDRTYTGPVLVALRRLVPGCPEPELPCKIAQLVPFPALHFAVEEVGTLDDSVRGAGGFGSTGR